MRPYIFRSALVIGCLALLSARAEPYNEARDSAAWFNPENYQNNEALVDPDWGLGSYDSPSFGPDLVQALTHYDAYDSTWPSPKQSPDLYNHNVWDPEIGSPAHKTTRFGTGRARVLKGTVDEIRNIRLEDRWRNQDQHSVARVILDDGRSVLVDLGGRRRDDKAWLLPGDEIMARGETGRIEGRRVLVADSIRINGVSFKIDRVRRASGIIDEVVPIALTDESGKKHPFVELAFQNGDIFLADLRGTNMQHLGLNEGENVRLEGHLDQVSGRRVLRVDRITVDGQTHKLQQADQS